MFEITAGDIAALNDKDLRILVALLCEAVARQRGLDTSVVTYGGNQTAKDGGLDVRVSLPKAVKIEGYVPRPSTGYQVKKSAMARAAIVAEMKPKGKLRPSIRDLANQKGAYVIVSSGSATSDSELKIRLRAMAEAVKGLKNHNDLILDFYDRTRLASWVRDHGGMILWVRKTIGKSVPGWQPYGPWAHAPDGVQGEYLLDETLRVQTGQKEVNGGISVIDGLNRIRDLLRDPGKVARIVGLSGVGKTRFVQALFDNRVGMRPLDQALAIYTNMADDPDPQPIAMATDLIASRTRAVLIVDNCPANLHHRLTELCRAPDSTISVLTVEYDIRDDDPEGTEVFGLEPSSPALIEKFIGRRFPTLSRVDASTVAEFSGGNARIAVALATTVGKKETLAGLTDADLFERLFQQRNAPDGSLLLSAQACSLVYSFDGEDVSDGMDAELFRIGACVGQNADAVFRNVAELFRRELVQKRAKWRAVLPHAIANRLAAVALQNTPYRNVEAHLINGASDRLQISLSRRLSYLHASKEAATIVKQWLSPAGRLADIAKFGELERTMFRNVLPVASEAGLCALERALKAAPATGDLSIAPYVRQIRSLAWDATLFDRCVELLVAIAKRETGRNQSDEAHDAFKSLFPLYLSGTHATCTQRLAITKKLLDSTDETEKQLGRLALHEMLEAWHFSSIYDFEFGAHSRDHGYWPRTSKEVKQWYTTVLDEAVTIASSDTPAAVVARQEIGQQFRGIWSRTRLYDELEKVAHIISKKNHWKEGWIAARQTLHYDVKKGTKAAKRLIELEKLMRPIDLLQRVRSVLLTGPTYGLDFDDFDDDDTGAAPDIDKVARDLGELVGADPQAFEALLPEVVGTDGQLFYFGEGLAAGANDLRARWDQLVRAFTETELAQRNDIVLRGFIKGVHDKDRKLANAILDEVVTSEVLNRYLPSFQISVGVDKQGLARLHQSLRIGKTPIWSYQYISMGGVPKTINPKELTKLALEIAKKPEGYLVAVQIIYMRIHGDRSGQQPVAQETVYAGQELLRLVEFEQKNDREDYGLGILVGNCLVGSSGVPIAKSICQKLRDAILEHKVYASNFDHLLKALAKVQPTAMLDGLFDGSSAQHSAQVMGTMRVHRLNVLDGISTQALLAWCNIDPKRRYPLAAMVISAVETTPEDAAIRWTNSGLSLLEAAPDRIEILRIYMTQLLPMSWSGSRASIIEKNAKLLDELLTYPDASVVKFITAAKTRFATQVDAERKAEKEQARYTDERFE